MKLSKFIDQGKIQISSYKETLDASSNNQVQNQNISESTDSLISQALSALDKQFNPKK